MCRDIKRNTWHKHTILLKRRAGGQILKVLFPFVGHFDQSGGRMSVMVRDERRLTDRNVRCFMILRTKDI